MKDKKEELIKILSADNHIYFKIMHAFRVIFIDTKKTKLQFELFEFYCENFFSVPVDLEYELTFSEFYKSIDDEFEYIENIQQIIDSVSEFISDMKKKKVGYKMAIINSFNVITKGEKNIDKFILMYSLFISDLLPYDLDVKKYNEMDFKNFSTKITEERKNFILNYIRFIVDTTYSGEIDENGEIIITAGFVIGFHELFNIAKDLNERMLITVNFVEYFKQALLTGQNRLASDLDFDVAKNVIN